MSALCFDCNGTGIAGVDHEDPYLDVKCGTCNGTGKETTGDRFCPLCGVVRDLHDGPDTCRSAGMKADLLGQFWMLS